jgi:hypothetical protein
MGPDNHYNSRDVFNKLVKRASYYPDVEIFTAYIRGDFAKTFPFEETKNGLVIAEKPDPDEAMVLRPFGTAPSPVNIIDRYSRLIPSKDRCMFFSFTAYDNIILGEKEEIAEEAKAQP